MTTGFVAETYRFIRRMMHDPAIADKIHVLAAELEKGESVVGTDYLSKEAAQCEYGAGGLMVWYPLQKR